MSASFENSAEVTKLEKVNFLSNPKERQYQRMFKLLYNCPHFTQCSKYRLTPSQPHTKALLASVLFTCQIIPGFQPKNQKICQRQLCIFSNRKSRGNRNQFIVRFFFFSFPLELLKYKCEYVKHENLIKVCCMFHFFCLFTQ